MSNKSKIIFYYSIIFVLIFTFFIIMFEIIVPKIIDIPHVVYRYWENRPVTYHPNLRNRAVTNSYDNYFKTNSLGFKDIEHNISDKSNYRILLLGDSYVEAEGVDPKQHMARNIEDLGKKNQKNIEVISMGQSGWGQAHHLATYERIGRFFNPDLVITFFCVNDLHDNNRNENTTMGNPPMPIYTIENNKLILRLPEKERSLTLKEMILRKLNKLETYHIVRYIYKKIYYNFLVPQEDLNIADLLTPNDQTPELTIGDWASDDDFDYFYLILDKMKEDIVKRDNAKLISVIVSGGLNEEMHQTYFEFLKKVEETFIDKEIKTINFDRIFREQYKETGILPHWEKDAHWNELGHQMVAKILYDELLK